MKTWDTIVVGGGIIGVSLAISLRKRGASVLVVEKGEPGREASYAAAGMLADHGDEFPPALIPLARASARMYPEFVHELQDESGIKVDLRDTGTILLHEGVPELQAALPAPLPELEPELDCAGRSASYLKERSVNPRLLFAAALKAARHRDVDISSGAHVTEILIDNGCVCGVTTTKTVYHAKTVVNCAGAWAGQLPPVNMPTRPVKGQILSVIGGANLHHVVRAPEIYLVPRSDGQIVIGGTLEEAGYDKHVLPETIQGLLRLATKLVPSLAKAQIHEAWAGLRPATSDKLPILGKTSIGGYYAATGHFRDGILLAPITAQVMTELILDKACSQDLSPFSAARFSSTQPQNFLQAV